MSHKCNILSINSALKENSKNCAIHNGAKLSDGTANGIVNSDALGKVSVLLDLIKNNPGCRANRLAKMLGKGLRTVKRYIAALVLLKQIEFRGAPKNGGYYILEKE